MTVKNGFYQITLDELLDVAMTIASPKGDSI
jgi:hypothetical protein